jgi:hypothetical protein
MGQDRGFGTSRYSTSRLIATSGSKTASPDNVHRETAIHSRADITRVD